MFSVFYKLKENKGKETEMVVFETRYFEIRKLSVGTNNSSFDQLCKTLSSNFFYVASGI